MPLLLGLTASSAAPRLPLADASAASLVGTLLTGASPEARNMLAAALARDPGLALWAVCRCHVLGGGERRTVAELAAWLVDAPRSALGEGLETTIRPLDDPALTERCATMAGSAIAVAKLAAEAAGPDEAERAYLFGLLHDAPAWMSLGGGAVQREDWLPGWLVRDLSCRGQSQESAQCAAVSCVARAIASLATSADGSPSQIDPSAAWLATVPGIADWLPALIARLERWQSLESAFQHTLEAEKLASLAELAAGAGHEINNPLAVISGRAQMLIRDERDPERRHALAAINAQALRVHEMIADMMLFARPPAPKLAPVDAAEVVRSVIQSLQARAGETEIEFACDLPREPLWIDADRTQLIVALKALCENSLDAIGRRGRIEIIVRSSGESVPRQFALAPDPRPPVPTSVELIVRDNGPGIPPEVLRHIFDPFYSGRSAGRGIGFGLSKCWRIVTNHRGTIQVESTPGEGAVFTIRLPSAGVT